MSKNDVVIKITKPDNSNPPLVFKKPYCNELNHIKTCKVNNSTVQSGSKSNAKQNPGVTIITSTIRQHCLENVFNNFTRQNYYPKELIIILNKNSMNIDAWMKKAKQFKNVRVFRLDEKKSLGTCINYAIDKASYNFISKFDDDNFYAPSFIKGLMDTFKAKKADIVGKCSYFMYFEGSKTLAINCPNNENKYVGFLSGSALIIKKHVFKKVKFPEISHGEDTVFLQNCIKNSFRLYSANRYNYVCIRRKNLKGHTWKADENKLLKSCKIVTKTNDYKKYVIRN